MQGQYQGRTIEVADIEVLSSKEDWNEYQLANGTILRIKTTLVQVTRALTEKSPDGKALYQLRTTMITDVRE